MHIHSQLVPESSELEEDFIIIPRTLELEDDFDTEIDDDFAIVEDSDKENRAPSTEIYL